MRQFFCDFETYYDPEYSLSKMPTAQYIMDDRFQAIMMTWSIGGDIFVAVGDENIRKVLAEQDWANTELVSHNTGFDGNILSLRYGVIPARYADTMAMCRNTGAHMFSGASLDAVAKVLQNVGIVVPDKGSEVHNMRYKRLFKHSPSGHWYMRETPIEGNSPEHLQLLAKCADDFSKYVSYCRTDTLICMKAYHYFKKLITPDEMDFIHIMTSCWCNPIFYLDTNLLNEELVRLENRNKEELQECADRYFGGSTAKALTTFRSAKQFADMLRSMGGVTQSEAEQMMEAPLFIIPTTISERTGKEGWSFGKTSTAFIELCEAGIPEVSDLCRLKLECTSSIEKSRTERFKALSMLRFPDGRPVPFGMPYTVSQAGTHRLGGCVTADTKVLVVTEQGVIMIKNIVDVLLSDLVWDGEFFCEHEGVAFRGYQEVITHDGITGTKSHPCFINTNETRGLAELKERGEKIMDCPAPKNWKPDADGSR